MVNPHAAPQLPAEGSYTQRPLRYTSETSPFLYLCVPYSVGRELFGHVLKRPLSLNCNEQFYNTTCSGCALRQAILLSLMLRKTSRSRSVDFVQHKNML